jgi:hypothetical protein
MKLSGLVAIFWREQTSKHLWGRNWRKASLEKRNITWDYNIKMDEQQYFQLTDFEKIKQLVKECEVFLEESIAHQFCKKVNMC